MGKGNGGSGASSLSDWKARSLMRVALPSGATVTLRALTLDELAAEDALPDDLVRVAMLNMRPGALAMQLAEHVNAGDREKADELSRANLDLRNRIVLAAVVDPKITADDLADIDPYDKAMIAQLAQRLIDTDAEGVRVGADSLEPFRRGAAQLASVEADEARRALLLELAEVQ